MWGEGLGSQRDTTAVVVTDVAMGVVVNRRWRRPLLSVWHDICWPGRRNNQSVSQWETIRSRQEIVKPLFCIVGEASSDNEVHTHKCHFLENLPIYSHDQCYTKYSINRLGSSYIRCMKIFFNYPKYYSVTAMLLELGLPSFDTLLYNSRIRFGNRLQCSQSSTVAQLRVIFTARCTLVKKRGIAIACRLSICLSVCL